MSLGGGRFPVVRRRSLLGMAAVAGLAACGSPSAPTRDGAGEIAANASTRSVSDHGSAVPVACDPVKAVPAIRLVGVGPAEQPPL